MQHVELWLALARLEEYSRAKYYINQALKVQRVYRCSDWQLAPLAVQCDVHIRSALHEREPHKADAQQHQDVLPGLKARQPETLTVAVQHIKAEPAIYFTAAKLEEAHYKQQAEGLVKAAAGASPDIRAVVLGAS